ncbi:hypothetical protein M23134_05393 [Microscilla marina ATCC 23134]|uniref:Uncharacterized protein n=1 Tax=Microscilla marina ATCC 23134 TaxID=313606 RepID=A1ZHQ3_MICM2|nr:hypothetical protein M23134_05393 [Microscilla marina ATCC 23134]
MSLELKIIFQPISDLEKIRCANLRKYIVLRQFKKNGA